MIDVIKWIYLFCLVIGLGIFFVAIIHIAWEDWKKRYNASLNGSESRQHKE